MCITRKSVSSASGDCSSSLSWRKFSRAPTGFECALFECPVWPTGSSHFSFSISPCYWLTHCNRLIGQSPLAKQRPGLNHWQHLSKRSINQSIVANKRALREKHSNIHSYAHLWRQKKAVPNQISLGWKKRTSNWEKTAPLIQRTYAGWHESKAHSHIRWLAFVWRLFICPWGLTQRDPSRKAKPMDWRGPTNQAQIGQTKGARRPVGGSDG